MPLPTAVRRRADAVRSQARDAQAAPPANEEQEVVDAVAATPERAPPEAEAPRSEPQKEERAPPPPSDDKAPEPVVNEPQSEPQGFIDPSDYEARYKALRSSRDGGRAEVQAAQNEVAALKREVEALRAQADRRETPEPTAKRFEIDAQSREYLGDTEAKLFDSLAASADQRFEQLQAETRRLESEIESRKQRDKGRFFEDLSTLVPNWRDLNEHQPFLSWLSGLDPSTGSQRQSLLNSFVDDHDSASVAKLFTAYQRDTQVAKPDRQPAQPEHSPEPGTARPTGTHGAEERLVEIYSPREVSEFYERKSALYRGGKLHGEMLEKIQAEEAKIKQAISDNRIG